MEENIEAVFVRLLNGVPHVSPNDAGGVRNPEEGGRVGKVGRGKSGEMGGGGKGKVVMCEEVEKVVFRSSSFSSSPSLSEGEGPVQHGEREEGGGSEDSNDDDTNDIDGGVPLSPRPQKPTTTNSPRRRDRPRSPGLEGRSQDLETGDDKRKRGLHVAGQREKVRQAGRRGAVFGFLSGRGEGERRKVEVVQNGRVVEGSFAKGTWGVRWI